METRIAFFQILNFKFEIQSLRETLCDLCVSVVNAVGEDFTTETGDAPTEFHGENSDSFAFSTALVSRFLKTKIIPTIKITVTIPANLNTFITTTPYFPVIGS